MKRISWISSCLMALVYIFCISTVSATGLSDTSARPTYGSGPILIEYFRDYECGPCALFTETELPYLQFLARKNVITLIIRQYPLTSYHKNAYRDALAALCAHEQGQYDTYSRSLYALEKRRQHASVSDADRIGIARKLRLDVRIFGSCLKSSKYQDTIDEDIVLGDIYRVNGIPALVRDGYLLDIRSDLRQQADILLGKR